MRTSREDLIDFNFSLCETPKRCSSSMIKSPRFLKPNFPERILWVPIRMSICPDIALLMISFVCFVVLKREINSIETGNY